MRTAGLVQRVGGPFQTINEAQAMENMPAIAGGDVIRDPAPPTFSLTGPAAPAPPDTPADPTPAPDPVLTDA